MYDSYINRYSCQCDHETPCISCLLPLTIPPLIHFSFKSFCFFLSPCTCTGTYLHTSCHYNSKPLPPPLLCNCSSKYQGHSLNLPRIYHNWNYVPPTLRLNLPTYSKKNLRCLSIAPSSHSTYLD